MTSVGELTTNLLVNEFQHTYISDVNLFSFDSNNNSPTNMRPKTDGF